MSKGEKAGSEATKSQSGATMNMVEELELEKKALYKQLDWAMGRIREQDGRKGAIIAALCLCAASGAVMGSLIALLAMWLSK